MPERQIYWLPLVGNLAMYPDQESNRGPLALQDAAQPTEPHKSGAGPPFNQ